MDTLYANITKDHPVKPKESFETQYTESMDELSCTTPFSADEITQLPYAFASLVKASKGIGHLPLFNAIWLSTSTQLCLYFFVKKMTSTLIGFVDPILKVLDFPAPKGLFKEGFNCLLAATKSTISIFICDSENINLTEFVTNFSRDILDIKIFEDNILVVTADGDVHQVTLNKSRSLIFMTFYSTNISASSLFSSILNLSIFMDVSEQPSQTFQDMVVGKGYAVVLYSRDAVIYKKRKRRFVKHLTVSCLRPDGLKVILLEENDKTVLFSIVYRDGSRDFYTPEYSFSKKTLTFYKMNEIAVVRCTEPDNFIIYKEETNPVLHLISFNKFHRYNPSRIRPFENYKLVPVESGYKKILAVKEGVLIVYENHCLLKRYLTKDDFLLNCKPEEIYDFMKGFGEREADLILLKMVANGKDMGRVRPFLKKINEKSIQEFLRFLLNYISPTFTTDRVGKLTLIRLECVIMKLTRVMDLLSNLIDCSSIRKVKEILEFTKIMRNYGINTNNLFYEAFTTVTFITEGVEELFSEVTSSTRYLLNLLQDGCPSLIPIDESFIRLGDHALAFKNYNEALEFYMQSMSISRLEGAARRLAKKRFYKGAVKIVYRIFMLYNHCEINEDTVFDEFLTEKGIRNIYEFFISLMNEVMRCKGSMDFSLVQDHDDFAFIMFEAFLKELRTPNDIYKLDLTCTCCGFAPDVKLYRNDVLRFKSPYLRDYLETNYNSGFARQLDKDLLFKYYMLQGEKEKAIEVLMKILAEPGDTRPKERYLYILATISIKYKVLVKLYDVQTKLIDRIGRDDASYVLKNHFVSGHDLVNMFTSPLQYHDLTIVVFNILGYERTAQYKNIWFAHLCGDYDECLESMKIVKNSLYINESMRSLHVIGDILLTKNFKPTMGANLVDLGFAKLMVKNFINERIKKFKDKEPKIVAKLININEQMDSYIGLDNHAKRVRRECTAKVFL